MAIFGIVLSLLDDSDSSLYIPCIAVGGVICCCVGCLGTAFKACDDPFEGRFASTRASDLSMKSERDRLDRARAMRLHLNNNYNSNRPAVIQMP